MSWEPVNLATIEAKGAPSCPTCGKAMTHHGGTRGYICCGWKLLYRADGWVKDGRHVRDRRLSGAQS
jgi:tRNA(Ile2) C34 agmatinyltransferase TiaS